MLPLSQNNTPRCGLFSEYATEHSGPLGYPSADLPPENEFRLEPTYRLSSQHNLICPPVSQVVAADRRWDRAGWDRSEAWPTLRSTQYLPKALLDTSLVLSFCQERPC